MRLGIYIPDELYRRLQPLKGHFNFSEVCRAALEELVDYREQALMRVEWDGLEEVADRYRLQDEVITVNWGELGTLCAAQWTSEAEPRQMEQLLHRLEVLKSRGEAPWLVPLPGVGEVRDFDQTYYLEQRLLLERFGDDLYDREDFQMHFQRSKAMRQFMEAFLAYVLTARDAIRQGNRSGRPGVFAVDANAPPITSEDVREGMSDFP